MSNDGTAAISANAGSVLDCLWRRNSSVASEDTNRSRYSSECWNLSSLPGRKLSCGERRRKVGYLRAATFNGKSGDPWPGHMLIINTELSGMRALNPGSVV